MNEYFKEKEHESKLKIHFNLNWTVRLLPFGVSSVFIKEKESPHNEDIVFGDG